MSPILLRSVVRLILALALALAPLALPAASPRPTSAPNLIVILADDLGYGDLGCYGQPRIQTPRLDRMAAEGIRFTQFYAGATVCAPSRCVLMQGLHTGHCRVRGNAGSANPMAQSLRDEDVTLPEVLRTAGYVTGLVGKWGLGDSPAAEPGLPRRQGFDAFFGYLNQHHAHNYFPSFLWRNETRVPLPNSIPKEDAHGGGIASVRAVYSADLITDEALAFVRKHAAQRFFLCFTPTLPHANNEAGAKGMEIPDLGPYASQPWPEPVRGHAAMVSRLDADVGRLLDLLRQLHLESDTLVLFTSDNGPHREGGNQPEFNGSSGPFRGIKRDLYEGGIRVPMIAWGPGRVPAGQVRHDPWWAADLLPTLAQIAGARAPKNLDGEDVSGLLQGRASRPRHAPMYWEFHEGGFKQAVREGPWKAIRLRPDAPVALYRIDRDPGETTDLAPTAPRRARRLARLLSAMREDSTDWPLPPDRVANSGAR